MMMMIASKIDDAMATQQRREQQNNNATVSSAVCVVCCSENTTHEMKTIVVAPVDTGLALANSDHWTTNTYRNFLAVQSKILCGVGGIQIQD
jgi:hypothetical protein